MDQEGAVVLRPEQGLEDAVDLGVDGVAHGKSLAQAAGPLGTPAHRAKGMVRIGGEATGPSTDGDGLPAAEKMPFCETNPFCPPVAGRFNAPQKSRPGCERPESGRPNEPVVPGSPDGAVVEWPRVMGRSGGEVVAPKEPPALPAYLLACLPIGLVLYHSGRRNCHP